MDLRAAQIRAIGAIMIPAVMTSGSDIIAMAPAIHPNDGCAAGAGSGASRVIFGSGGVAALNRGGAAAGRGARGAVSDR